MYFGKPQDSSVNVPRFPGAASICPSAATREILVSLTDHDANLIWELINLHYLHRKVPKSISLAFGRPREFQNNVHFLRTCVVRHSTHTF